MIANGGNKRIRIIQLGSHDITLKPTDKQKYEDRRDIDWETLIKTYSRHD